jgi:hypothetical protein
MIRRLAPIALLALLAPLACSGTDDPPTNSADSTAVVDTGTDTGSDTAAIDSAEQDTGSADSSIVDSTINDVGAEVAVDGSGASETSSEGGSDATSDSADSGKCKSGAVEEESCGKCGTRSRLCEGGTWLPFGGCFAETGSCTPGETRSGSCGRCGTRSQTCSATCTWDSMACTGEGACVPGSTETQYGVCLDATKVKTRTCSDACAWADWSDCK